MSPKTETGSARGGRYYVWRSPDGEETERYFSVTTIIDNGIPKPALLGWAVKETSLYALSNLEILKAHLDKDRGPDGQLPPADPKTRKPTGQGGKEAYKLLWDARWAYSQPKADLGSAIHEAIEAYVLDKPAPQWDAVIQPYLEQAMRFLRDFEVLVEATETSVFNRTQKYAGTLDMIATIAGERWLVDFKTGSGVYPEVALQLAAYAHAEFIGKPDRTEEPMPPIDRAMAVHLGPDFYSPIVMPIHEGVFNHFCYARETFRWCEFLSKTVKDDMTALTSLQDLEPKPEEVPA